MKTSINSGLHSLIPELLNPCQPRYRWLARLAMAALLGMPLANDATIVNVDFNGMRADNPDAATYVGEGAAGGGTVFNGVLVDSRVGDGTDNDFLTITAGNLANDTGGATTFGFTISPVGGGNDNPAGTAPSSAVALLKDYLIVGYFGQDGGANTSADFTISGLGSAPFADLYFYTRGDGWPGAYTIGTAVPAAFAPTGIFTASTVTYFQGVPVSGGKITGNFRELGSGTSLGIMTGLTIRTPDAGLYLKSTSPAGSGVLPDAPIKVEVWQYLTELKTDSVQVSLNDEIVPHTAAVVPTGASFWTITASPSGGFKQGATNTVRVIFSDTATPPVLHTNEFSFAVVDAAKASAVVNVDINGWRGAENPAITYVGEGAAGGGTVFNAVAADSTGGDDNLTITGNNLKDSLGNTTTVSFTLTPIAGENLSGTADPTAKDNLFADFASVGLGDQTTGTSDFTISGLGSAPTADLFLYFREDPASDGRFAGSAYIIPGGDIFAFASGIFNSGNTVYLKNVPVVDGKITGIFSGNVGSGGEGSAAGALSGFSIQTPLPEPYVKTALPRGNYVRPDAVVAIDLQDYVTAVATNSIQLFVNGKEVAPTITKAAGSTVTQLRYTPPQGLILEATNTMRVIFSNNATPPVVQTADFSFTVISPFKASKIINIDINGVGHSPIPVGPTYVGQGAAGGGNVFNGILADSNLPDTVPPNGPYDDNLTIGGTNLLDSLGTPTTVNFTLSPVGGGNSGAVGGKTSENWAALNHDWILVGYFGQTSGSADFTVSGLGSAPIANLYFYFREDARENGRFGSGSYTIPGVAGPAAFAGRGVFGNQNTTFLKNIPVTDGKITGTFKSVSVLAIMTGLTIEMPLPQPYVKSYGPAGLVKPSAQIKIELADFVTQVVPDTIQLFVNDQAVTPTLTKPTGSTVTTVTYSAPNGLPQGAPVNVRIVFGDNATPSVVQSQEFTFEVLDALKASKIVNIDINGVRNPQEPGPTYVGQGAAGGGTVFNGLMADCRLSDGQNDDNVTVTGSNLSDSVGDATSIGFTISPVGGEHAPAASDPNSINAMLADYLWVNLAGQTSGSADFTISGLGTNTTVDLYFYQRGDGPGVYDIPGTIETTLGSVGGYNSGNTKYFKNVPVTNGQLTGTFSATSGYGLISGLTIALPIPATTIPGPIRIARPGTQPTLSWTGAGTLQSATTIAGPWADVTGATTPYSVDVTASAKFFRLRQ